MRNHWLLIVLFIFGVVIALAASFGQTMPGYMDADYYYAGGIQLYKGFGFSEPFLWNYLDNPSGLPHPSHLYWMPLASIIAAGGMAIAGSDNFFAARWPFLLISGLLPVLSACLANNLLTHKKYAWIGGVLGLFPGMFIIYLSIPETFVLYLVLGGLFTLVILRIDWLLLDTAGFIRNAGILGIVAGLMHLSRADGIIWFAGGFSWLIWVIKSSWESKKLRIASISVGVFVLGYLLVMGPWYLRNLDLFNSLFPDGNNRALWLTSYNQTFTYPAHKINFSSWWMAGIEARIHAWWFGLKMNLGNLITVNGLVVLLPLQAAGIWTNRKKPAIVFSMIMLLLTFLLMTFIFPYSGARGGFLHSASAFQPLLWAGSTAGLEVFVYWGERKRDWKPVNAMPRFAILLIFICAVLTGWFYTSKIFPTNSNMSAWASSYQSYEELITELDHINNYNDALYMVNNPPGFFVATNKPSIVIPGGGIDETLAAGERYGAEYLILESGQENLSNLFESPIDHGNLKYLKTISGMRVFCFGCQSGN